MALSFNGSNQYVIKNSDLGITGGVITLSIWVKLNAEISSGEWCFVSQIDAGTHVKYAIDYKYNSGTRQLSFYRTRYAVVDNQATYNITLGTSNWYHLVLTYDGSNVKGYVNGVLQAGPTASSGNGTSGGSDCFAVASEGGTIFYANATLFDARCYNRVITDNEISEIYHKRGADRVWQGLVGRWRLDELPGGTAAPALLDSMDSTSGWTVIGGYGTVSVNTTTYLQGTGALNFTKTSKASGSRDFYMLKTISATNITNQTIKCNLYIKDSTTLAKISSAELYLYCPNIANRIDKDFSSLSVGWNSLYAHVDDFAVAGSPNLANLQMIRVDVNTVSDDSTWSEGDVIVDFYRTGDYPSSIYDLSGNGNHGTPYNSPVYQASPHRLRRGVLVS